MKKTGGITPVTKILIIALILGGIFGLFKLFEDKLTSVIPKPGMSDNSTPLSSDESNSTIKIGVVTWGGYAGGEYFNKGFKASKESQFYKDYGLLVDFVLIDDFNDSRNAWKSGDIDLCWATVDAFTTEVEGLKEFKPRIIFQSDWSRGGDAIVVRRGIKKVTDLKGLKIAVAPMTPSHTFLLSLFNAGELSMKDVTIIEVANAIDAADLFKKGSVDAAVVWSPDDADCIAKVEGSSILMSTKTASNIIADVFFVKDKFLQEHTKELSNLVEGWLKGAAEINSSENAKTEASKILAAGLNQPADFCLGAINNARLCTYGDNADFFNINGKFSGVTGEDLYNNNSISYANAGYIKKDNGGQPIIENWRTIGNPSIIRNLTTLNITEQKSENFASFPIATTADESRVAVSTKKVSISFPSGSSNLDDNAKYIIDKEFTDIAKGFSGARIRIEGNTDNTGKYDLNKRLSKERAQVVVEYLINEHKFDRNRFIVIGNGPDKAVATNDSDQGRAKNRRTDFELLPQ